jgi:thymidylate synthase
LLFIIQMLKRVAECNKYKNRDRNASEQHDEYQYLNLLQDILDEGHNEVGRNGNTRCVFGAAMHFSLENGKIPILTTKKTAWKTCLKELLWFIKGQTDNKILTDQNVHIWDGNTTPEFMASRGLSHYQEGDIGPMYGFQWSHFNAPYEGCSADYTGKGINQLQQVIDTLKNPETRASRRMVISAWNPCQIDQGVLPPCHVLFQFNVVDGNKLSCCLMQRSGDEFLGICFNIVSYSFLVCLIAKHCDLEPYEFIHYGGNCHIYDDHFDQVKEQLTRTPYEFPTLEILNKRENINDYVVDDFKISNYQHHQQIKAAMRA